MVRHKFLFSCLFCLFCLLIFGHNVFAIEDTDCSEDFETFSDWSEGEGDDGGGGYEVVHSRVKRGFGGKEPVNITLVNTNVLGAPGFLPLICGAFIDMVLHVTGYIVLGKMSMVCILPEIRTRKKVVVLN